MRRWAIRERGNVTTPHLRKAFDPFQLRRIAATTEQLRVEYDAEIVLARGLSGTLVAAAMSTLFSTPFAVVRKEHENSHGRLLEVVDYDEAKAKSKEYRNWIIVDDLISSGSTVEAIFKAVEVFPSLFKGECVGMVLYHRETAEGDERSSHTLDDGRRFPVFNIERRLRDVPD